MKRKLLLLTATFTFFLSQSMTVFAVTEAEVEAVGKSIATGNVFIWFLCAIAFLKISQKISKNPKEKWQEARTGTLQKRIYKLQINM